MAICDEQMSRDARHISLSLEQGFKVSIAIASGCWQVHSSFLGASTFREAWSGTGRARTRFAQRLFGIPKRLERTEMPEIPDTSERYKVIVRKEDSLTAP